MRRNGKRIGLMDCFGALLSSRDGFSTLSVVNIIGECIIARMGGFGQIVSGVWKMGVSMSSKLKTCGARMRVKWRRLDRFILCPLIST